MWLLPEEEHLISGDLIRQITLTGTVAALRERIRLLRDPTQTQAVRNELNDEDYARLQLSMSDDIDSLFKNLETAFEKHVNGVDPVNQLRSYRFAEYRKDPRYIRLLNKAGFDDEGKIR